jgi:guanylate cyclase
MYSPASAGWRSRVDRLAKIGVLPTDSRDEALRKETLVLAAAFITALSVAWVATYSALGLYLSAAIPLAYQLAAIVNLVVLARTKRFRFFRACELALSLLLPFVLQLSLGGFVASSGVVLWSFTAPLGALLFSGRKEAARWFAAFLAVIVLSAALDPFLSNKTLEIPHWIRISFFGLNVLGVTGTCYFLLHYFVRERDRAAEMVAAERERSERLLLNVLPQPISERLKAGESLIADGFPEVGVLWGDTVNTASRMESHGIPGAIQVSERARMHLASGFEFEDRGIVEVKGKGPMRTFLLLGRKKAASVQDEAFPGAAELGTSCPF